MRTAAGLALAEFFRRDKPRCGPTCRDVGGAPTWKLRQEFLKIESTDVIDARVQVTTL